MTNELSDKDADKLLNQITNAMKDGDSTKLDELMASEVVPEEPEVTFEEDEVAEDESPEETPADEDQPEIEEEDKTKDDPQDKADQPVDKKESEPTDELSKLKDQLAALANENHKLRSQAGRVPHVQRRLQELDKKLADLETKKSTPSNQPSDVVLEKLKGIKETDPELAQAIADAVAAATSGLTEQLHNKDRETLHLLREQELAQQHENEIDRLLVMYPNAVEVFQSKTWKDWKATLSPGIKALAESDNADDVAHAFEMYGQAMLEKHPELAPKEEHSATPVTKTNPEAEKIEQQRQRKKQTTAVVGSPNASGKVAVPDDPDALFKKYFAQIQKERSGN